MSHHDPTLDRLFGALAHQARRDVLHRLGAGAAPVSALAEPFDMALPNFLKHVRMLESAGLISTEKEGRTRICTLVPDRLRPAEAWITDSRRLWAGRLDRLDKFLDEGDQG